MFNLCRSQLALCCPSFAARGRHLSSSEAAIALRPFYFAVHPDLFGQHPKERAINEDSLKKLNQCLQNVQTNQQVNSTQLSFFVRNTSKRAIPRLGAKTFREVHISLPSNSPREIVKTVLQSCNLSLDYVDSISSHQTAAQTGTNRSHLWDATFYDFHGIPNPGFDISQKKPHLKFKAWLKKNEIAARKKQEAMLPTLAQIERLKLHLRAELGVSEVLWQSQWGLVQFRACLCSFVRLYNEHKHEINIRGHTLVFGSKNGLCLRGHIILRKDDIPTNWLQFLHRVRPQAELYQTLPILEHTLSNQLNNIRVIPPLPHRPVLIGDYIARLTSLTKALDKFWVDRPDTVFDQNLNDLELTVEGESHSLRITEEGNISVPSSCPGFLLIEFLARNANKARETRDQYLSRTSRDKKLISEVVSTFSLSSLTPDDNISAAHMSEFCQSVLDDRHNILAEIRGCKVKVARFYSVMSDGEMYIPWNWRQLDEKQSES